MEAHKKHNLETTHNRNLGRRRRNSTLPSTSSQDFKKPHEEFFITKASLVAAGEGDHKASERSTTPPPPLPQQPDASMVVEEESGRERLKRHRVEMSGRVWIPDIWGQEDLLNKWIDCTVFDSSVQKNSVVSAREALIQEGRSTLRIENSC